MEKSGYKLPYYGDEIKQLLQKIENLSKSDVGLDKVDNTSDIDKPISTAMQSALNDLQNAIDIALDTAKTYTDTEIATFDFVKVVSELPEIGLENKIYFVTKLESKSSDIFDEYIWINSNWEYIGTKQIEVDLSDKLSSVVRVWQPNTYYEGGDKVIVIDESSWNCFVKNCIETHTSGDTYDSSYWSYDDLYIKEVLYSWESGRSNVADDYTDEGAIATKFSYLQESKSDKTQIGIIEGTEPYIDFINLYNIDVRCTAVDDINSITFEFTDGEYEEDYHAGLTFSTGDTPPQISYTNSGILNWVGIDCKLVDGMSIFTPAANKRYNIVFEFDGERFIGYVSGFTPATVNNA